MLGARAGVGCVSPTASPGGRARSGEVGRHQRKAAHACAEFVHRYERRWSCSPPPPLRSCSWPASAGALLVSIERKNPGVVGQHALGGAGPAEPLRAALRGQGREQCAHRVIRAKAIELDSFRRLLCGYSGVSLPFGKDSHLSNLTTFAELTCGTMPPLLVPMISSAPTVASLLMVRDSRRRLYNFSVQRGHP